MATRFGAVAVLGLPNAGKSTLVNHLCGSLVSIVTHKAQTTRARMRGIGILGQSQVVFVDTPGLYLARRARDRAIVTDIWAALREADAVLVLVDAAKAPTDSGDALLAGIGGRLPPAVPRALALNKIDRVHRPRLLDRVGRLNEQARFDETFLVSARTGDGVDRVAGWVAGIVPPGPWHYPADQASDMPRRVLAAEITREKLLLRLHQELPYELAVRPVSWEPAGRGRIRIRQQILVAREAHRRMVVGKGGSMLAEIRVAATRDIARALDERVLLELQVKVQRGWLADPRRLGALGFGRGGTGGAGAELAG